MSKTELIKKIMNIDDLSQSQLDRLNLQNEAYSSLVSFLHSAIDKIQDGNVLKQKLEKEINKLIDPDLDENPEAERFSPNQLLNLFAIMMKHDSEQSMTLINTLKESIKINVNQNNEGSQPNAGLFPTTVQGESYTKENIQSSKKTLKLIDSLEDSGLSIDELEDLIKNRKK